MPNISSPLGTANTGLPLVRADALGQAAGLAKSFASLTALTDAIAAGSAALWSHGEPIAVVSESAHGVWRMWDAVASHARTVLLRPGLRLVIGSDASAVLFAAGQPSAGTGANGDVSVDWSAGAYYIKASGTWGSAQAVYPEAGGAAPAAAGDGGSDWAILGGWAVATFGDNNPTTNVSSTCRRISTPICRGVSRVALYCASGPSAALAATGETPIGGPIIYSASIAPSASGKERPLTVGGARRWAVQPDGPGVVTDAIGMALAKGAQPAIKLYSRMLRAPAPAAASAAGGALAAATYYIKIAARAEGAESQLSAEVSATTTGADGTVTVTWTGQHRDDEVVAIYIGTASGAQTLLRAVPAYLGTYTITALTGQGAETGSTAAVGGHPQGYQSLLTAGDGNNRISNGGNGADLTNSATLPTTIAGPHTGGGPIALLLGDYGQNVTVPALYVLGDSIIVGNGHPVSGSGGMYSNGLGGYIPAALWARNKEDWCAHAVGGTRIQTLISGTSWAQGRLEKLRFARGAVYSEYGVNDLSGARTWQQVAADHITLSQVLPAGAVLRLTTITPATDQTDLGLTGAGQTTKAFEAQRTEYNAWVRGGSQVDGTGAPVLTGGTTSPRIDGAHFFDAAALVEVNASNVLTQDGGRWIVAAAPTHTGLVLTGTPTTTAFAVSGTPFAAQGVNSAGVATQLIVMTSGAQVGKIAAIASNTTSALTLYNGTLTGYTGVAPATANALTVAPAAGDTFNVLAVASLDGTHPASYGYGLLTAGFVAHLAALYG